MQRDRHVSIFPLTSCGRGLNCRSAACSATATFRSCRSRLACEASGVGALRAARPQRFILADVALHARFGSCRKRQSVSRRCRGASRRPCLCKASCTSNTPPAVRRAPSWRAVPCASRSSRGPRLTARPAPARTRGHPWPRPASPARTLDALRCSADLRGPRWKNPPSVAGPTRVPTVLLRMLGARHARSDAYAVNKRPAMDGGFVIRGP